ncbi:hypothetical protein C8Q77DRAFT_500059 [Trametes polyzona]|nr:hypothetical protein C8Q77DRAFT_500059 [Trametes polyzona]
MAPAQCVQCNAVYSSKTSCNRHRVETGHLAAAVFFCLDCSETFPKLKGLKQHRQRLNHTKTELTMLGGKLIAVPFASPPPESSIPPATTQICRQCEETFGSLWELTQHRRLAHNLEPAVEMRCPRCAQMAPLGTLGHNCIPPARTACPICKQRFGSAAGLTTHSRENPVSCEICAIHLPQGMVLQEHWRMSEQHPYCKMCDNAFKDTRSWTMHTWMCSLARDSPMLGVNVEVAMDDATHEEQARELPRACDGVDDDIVVLERNEFKKDVAVPRPSWSSSGFQQTISIPSEQSSRRSSLSSICQDADRAPNPAPSTSTTLADRGDMEGTDAFGADPSSKDSIGELISDLSAEELSEVLAREYGPHSIERILSVLESDDEDEEDEPVYKPRTGRSLLCSTLIPPMPWPTYGSSSDGCPADASLVAQLSSAGGSGRVIRPHSPPMLGYRREGRRLAPDTCETNENSAAPSARVKTWLDDVARLLLAGRSFMSYGASAPIPRAGLVDIRPIGFRELSM